jgi:hypothetical protein
MRVVVPLAGPDFVRENGVVKALATLEGSPLLPAVLSSRPWADEVPDDGYVFVMHDEPATRRFGVEELATWYPRARTVYLSDFARGAALSAAAGVAAAPDDGPLVVDLADIRFAAGVSPVDALTRDRTGGLAYVFDADDPVYSYLRTDADGRVVEAAEKRVISRHASAGVYGFASSAVFFRALAHALEHEEQAHNGLHYVCPLFNGVLAQGLSVELCHVRDVTDVKQLGIA